MAKQSFKDLIFKFLKKDEDAPANATGTAVAGTGDDSSTVVVKKKKELQKKLMTRMGITETINRTIPDLEYPKDEIRERVNQLKGLALGETPEGYAMVQKAKDIAKHAEFFSFGTNDLTQTTFGISRDDSGKFLNDYLENKIFSVDPFVSIDEGVSDLVEIAVEKGRKQNKNLKLGICGEHGGDPQSISFCSQVGLNYVSCSPYRVPIARLAAAQAELKKN